MEKGKRIDKTRLNSIHHFIRQFNKLKLLEKVVFLKQLTDEQVSYIEEICYNFLKSNIPTKERQVKLLSKLKKFIYSIISSKHSRKYKKKLISSVRGLHLLNVLVPLARNIVQQL